MQQSDYLHSLVAVRAAEVQNFNLFLEPHDLEQFRRIIQVSTHYGLTRIKRSRDSNSDFD